MSLLPVIVALDCNEWDQLTTLVSQLDPASCRVKVGKELYTAYGPEILRYLHRQGFQVFLDLKFHDIPHTVYRAIRVAADLGVWIVNVHASGGRKMLTEARRAITESQHKPLLIAVTILTSLSSAEVNEIGYQRDLPAQALHLAQLAYQCGLDGVVCSAHEAAAIKEATAPNFITVTPGIRLAEATSDDQTRIMTPSAALAAGADYLVIGRPITSASDPVAVLQQINQQIS